METSITVSDVRDDLSSYPTYEEWKQDSPHGVNSFTSVLILPMRNGNKARTKRKYTKRRRVLILPMRNGNW